MAIYDLVVPKDNMLRQINDLVDFSSFLNAALRFLITVFLDECFDFFFDEFDVVDFILITGFT